MLAGMTNRRRGHSSSTARRPRRAARRAASSPVLGWLARAGLAARGVEYLLIGIIAIQIAVGSSGRQADQTGAVRLVAATGFGSVVLWLMVIGFAGLMLWRLSEAIWGTAGRDGKAATKRAAALAKAVIYGAVAFGVLKYALGLGAPKSSDKQSQDLTAEILRWPGGQALVVVVGLALAGGGIYLAWQAWQKKFAQELRLTSASARTRKTVLHLGQAGGIARGVVAVTAGIFLIVAGLDANPKQAKGVDSALRTLAHTPAGPPVLIVVAVGLLMFAAYSCCAARWPAI